MPGKCYRGRLGKPDAQGRWRVRVGRSKDGKQERFQVGNKRDTTETEAQRRLDHIRDFYDRQCQEQNIDFWAGWALPWAHRLAAGPPIQVYASEYAKANDGQAAEEVTVVHKLQSWGVPIQVVDPHLLASGIEFLQKQIEERVNHVVKRALLDLEEIWGKATVSQVRHSAIPRNPAEAETRTLHEALDAYSKHLEDTGKRDQHDNLATRIRKCRDRLAYLKNHHKDCPIWKLNLPLIEKMASYWRNRPLTKRKTRCSWDHAHDMNKELFRFFNWLDKHPDYRWEKPKGIDDITRSPIELPEDAPQEAFQTARKKTYTPGQLAIISHYADPLGRAILGVCVNCAFGASEIGQWNTKLYSIHKAHPHADKVGIASTQEDSWIVGPRPKTKVYGEHLLWPEVADAVAPFLDGRPVLPMTRQNTPWYRTHSSNPQTRFNNWWSELVARAKKKHPELPSLPFGSLRDLLPDVLRREFSGEVASMCLQHGEVGEDDLLKCYANVPFKKLFDATNQLREKFRPFLDSLKL